MSWTPPVHDRSRELREQLSVEGWRAAIVAVLARHGFGTDALEPMASGSDVVWGAGPLVVKLTAPCWREELAAEARNLAHVAGRLPVATPEPLATGTLAGWPYVVMTRVAGRPLAAEWPALVPADRRRLAEELGDLAARLHACDRAGYTGAAPGEWDAFWSACLADVGARHARLGAPAALVAQVEPFLAACGPLPTEPRAPLHTELLGEHVLVVHDARGRARLGALIDFADGRVGPLPYELPTPAEFVFRGEGGLQRAFLAAHSPAAAALSPEHLLAWSLCHRFGNLARLVAAVAPARPGSLSELAGRLYGP